MSVCKVVRRGAAVWQVQIVRSVDGKRERVRRYFRRKDEAVLAEAGFDAGKLGALRAAGVTS